MNEPDSARRCAYCDTPLPPEEQRCPRCGAAYWDPVGPNDTESGAPSPPGTEAGGCLSLLALPLGVSLAVFAALILGGLLLERLLHWDSWPLRILWVAVSAGVGLRLYDRIREAGSPGDPDI